MLGASSSSATQAPAVCTPAPAIAGDFPDPSVLYDPASGEAFAYGTNIASAAGDLLNVPVSVAHDPELAGWSVPTDALPRLPKWAGASSTWAPAIAHLTGGPYRLYFAARYGFSGRQCIGVSVSQSPTGPFVPTDDIKPLVCTLAEGGAIDPDVFRDDDDSEYLLWKTDTNCCNGDPTLYIQKLAPDGLSLAGGDLSNAPWLLPEAKALIHRDQPWEGHVIEAPTLLKHDGLYYLFYSGNSYDSDRYAVGYATADSVLGPYQKAASPILESSTLGLRGPGGQDVFTGPRGETLIAFHAWQDQPVRHRALYLGRIAWDPAGPRVVTNCDGPAP
jgi:beta-xylosidase